MTPAGKRETRRDLEGLRAIAVLGVVTYHLRTSWLPGGFAGVDVFFVLSGFFITGLLLNESARTSTVDLLAFWGRRARRLLPAAAVVLVATLVVSAYFVDPLDAHRFSIDGVYASLFSVNWHYAALGTSYLADPDPSPLVHYWSLGVEEQFYLVWPVLLLGISVLVRRRRSPHLRIWVASLALAVTVVSFLVAWHLTVGLQPYAYFATYSRAWQLALGALLACAVPLLQRLPLAVRTLGRWTGVGAIVGFYVLAPLDITYPGLLALIPTLAAGLIIATGVPRMAGAPVSGRGDVIALGLTSRVSQLLGRYSYGWYLWHWPPLVLLPLMRHHALGARTLVLCAIASLLMAVLSYHLLEHPVRSSRVLISRRGRPSLALGVLLIVLAAGAGVATGAVATARVRDTHVLTASGVTVTPSPGVAATEQVVPHDDGCELSLSSHGMSPECRYLPDTGHGDVVLVGDSHAAQWFPSVYAVAKERGWGLRVWARASCPLADVSKVLFGGPGKNCDAWRDDVMTRLVAAKPDLVIVAGYASTVPALYNRSSGKLVHGKASQALYQAGLTKELTRLRGAGSNVLVIRDNPSFVLSGPKCVLEHGHSLSDCSAPREVALQTSVDLDAARAVAGVHVLDLTKSYCSTKRCYQVIGSTLAYRDTNHLTIEMIKRLKPELAAAAVSALG